MATLTPKIGLKKPSPNVELDWGFRWNENADILDDVVLSTNLSDAGNVTIIDDGAGNITISGTAASVAGASHADLSNLDYASSGHTGFASAAELLTVSGFLTDHGNLSGLTDDDHTQYILADGTRSFTGNVTIAGIYTLTASGITTSGITAHDGYFSESLTVSGLPVVTAIDPLVLASVTVDAPDDTEDITIMKAPRDILIQKMFAVIRGPGSPSVTWTIRHDANREATGTEVVAAGTTTTSTSHGDEITSMDNPTITGGSWIWLETTVTGGSPQELAVELYE